MLDKSGLVIVDIKFVTDNLALSMRKIQWRRRYVIVGFNFVTHETKTVSILSFAGTERVWGIKGNFWGKW
jgi:hypothetical protein